MNFSPDTLPKLRDRLAQAMFDSGETPLHDSLRLQVTPWIASSLLQKAIRRNQPDYAAAAALILMKHSPAQLWRRLGTVGFEDVGIADTLAVDLTVAALAGKRLRTELGGDWAVVSFIIRKLAAAHKCRAVDNLLMVAESHPRHARLRLDIASGNSRDALVVLGQSRSMEEKAVVVWSLFAHSRAGREGWSASDVRRVFCHYAEAGLPESVVEIAQEGHRKTGQALPLIYPLIWQNMPAAGDHADDPLPSEAFHSGLPLWAVDQYTHEGKRALRRFLETDCASARWIKSNVPHSAQVSLLGKMVFAVEGGQLRQGLRWPLGDNLKATWERDCMGQQCRDATSLLSMVAADIPTLNAVRATCL